MTLSGSLKERKKKKVKWKRLDLTTAFICLSNLKALSNKTLKFFTNFLLLFETSGTRLKWSFGPNLIMSILFMLSLKKKKLKTSSLLYHLDRLKEELRHSCYSVAMAGKSVYHANKAVSQ